jgi:hypothetical protein
MQQPASPYLSFALRRRAAAPPLPAPATAPPLTIRLTRAQLEEILKVQGYGWPVRKVALSTRLNMKFTVDKDGDLFYSSKVPFQGETKLKCVDGASFEVRLLGMTMAMSVQWDAGAIVMHQRTTSGGKTTEAFITQRYDPQLDRIISENDSVEGFYTRTFKRVER